LRARGAPVAATTRRPGLVAPDRPLLDLARPLADWSPPPGTRAACIFAAVARLAACENDPAGSAHVNVTQTTALIERLIAHDVAVVFASSDKVFDGTRPQMPADAPVAPNCEYGRQKAAIEALLRAHMGRGADAAILRLSKVVAPGSALFTDWIAALRARRKVRAFTDLMFAPVPIALVVAAVAALLADRAGGIFQLSGPRDISYSEAAHFLARRLGADETLIEDMSARDGGQPPGAAAPFTSLDSSALRARYGIVVPDAWEVLDRIP
jgi:dTDP-4-dehydrorhamnose reductase